MDAGIGVPTIEVRGLREVGIAPQEDLTESPPEADGHTVIGFGCRSFVGGAVSRAIDQAKNLARVGEGQNQGVVSPGAVVGNIHPLLATSGGRDECSIHVDDRAVEEG